MTIYTKTTEDISISVEAKYEADRSQPKNSLFVFTYRVNIENNGATTIQIYRRSWVITDAYFNLEYVEGEGVVGEKPIIGPGQSYSYTSLCPLKTSFGSMHGFYVAVDNTGKEIKIYIPEFTLAHPFAVQ